MRFQAPKIQLPLIGEHRMRHSRHIRHIDSPHLCEGMSAPIGCQLSAYLKKWLWMTYAMLPFMMQWMPYAHAAIPELVSVSAADVTARSALITYVLSEPCDVQVVLYLDAQGTIRSTDHIVQSTPFRTSTTTTRASQRNLGASRLERLTPNTDYFAKLVLTSKSTLQVKTFPVSGTIAFTTGALINLQDFGGQTFSDAVIYDLTPSLGTAAGSLALLDVEGALSPLASFVGEATPSEVACFDLNNLMDQTNGSRWQPPPSPLWCWSAGLIIRRVRYVAIDCLPPSWADKPVSCLMSSSSTWPPAGPILRWTLSLKIADRRLCSVSYGKVSISFTAPCPDKDGWEAV